MAQVFKCPFGLGFDSFAAKYAATDLVMFGKLKKS